ncbi:MAG: hypothetical protein J5898_11455 [Lachnospiraceae bacterium]|nr:hypothetical protein [Lachnospiraceae bacterium]
MAGFGMKLRERFGSGRAVKAEEEVTENTAGQPEMISDTVAEEEPLTVQEAAAEGEGEPAETTEEKGLSKAEKLQEAAKKVKEFAYKNKDALILGGQLALVVLVCAVGIKHDLDNQFGGGRKGKKGRRRR